MKSIRSLLLVAALSAPVLVPLSAASTSIQSLPGYVDFTELLSASPGADSVEINIQGGLLTFASHLVAFQEPEVGKLLKNLRSVRVNVFTVDDSNRADLARSMDAIRKTLGAQGWTKAIAVHGSSEDVNVYVKMDASDAIEGVAITVLDGGREAVFINVVGNIEPGQLAALGEHLGIEPLKRAGRRARS